MGFLRKVYGLLSVQLALTTLIAAVCLFTPQIKTLVHENTWLLMVAFIASFCLLFALFLKSREHPTNLILLAAFTVVEAYTIGVLVTFYDVAVVVQAFFLTGASWPDSLRSHSKPREIFHLGAPACSPACGFSSSVGLCLPWLEGGVQPN